MTADETPILSRRRLRPRSGQKDYSTVVRKKRSISDVDESPKWSTKLKRISLNVNKNDNVITHPSQIPHPKYHGLSEYLQSYICFDDDEIPAEEYPDKVVESIQLVKRLRTALEYGVLEIDPTSNKIQKNQHFKPFSDPFLNITTHHDHLMAHAVKMAKFYKDHSKGKVAKCKKIATMIENHFKKLEGEKDREIREHQRHVKKLAKKTASLVKKRWKNAEKAYKIIMNKRLELQKMEESKKTMNQMVLDSSLRAVGHAISGLSNNQTIHSDSESEEDDESDVDDESMFMNEKENEKNYINKLDLYSPNEHEPMEDTKKNNNNSEEMQSDINILTEDDIEKFKKLQDNEDHNSLLDSDEEISESDDEEEDSEGTDASGYELGEPEEELIGLASLFGKPLADEDDSDSETNHDNSDTERKTDESVDNSDIEMSSDKTSIEIFKLKKGTPEGQDASIPDVPIPQLLRGTLRAYQKQGLNWLANLYNNKTNGILADEMGLGKTIQTISLLSYLACEKHVWGPHLIVVPTSVMLNWEMEFKRFAPGFKVLTYYGNPQQRKEKRKGWNNPDSFHVCITSYQLVCHDQQAFKRKKWEYMILDEAHNIKNFRTARWQALLNFNTKRRLLVTGTPLQNNLAELWSLLYFLMPSSSNNSKMPEGFASLENFQQWFGKPVDKIVEGGGYDSNDNETKEIINKLHKVLRPYLLRRLKVDVETQMPLKYEHIVTCKLSKRQRFLYDDFMSRAQTKETLASGNFLSIINCLMQLRKVCNHPDLFEVRPILSPFSINYSICKEYKESIPHMFTNLVQPQADLDLLGFLFTNHEMSLTNREALSLNQLNAENKLKKECLKLEKVLAEKINPCYIDIHKFYKYLKYAEQVAALEKFNHIIYLNNLKCSKTPTFGKTLIDILTIDNFYNDSLYYSNKGVHYFENDLIKPLSTRILEVEESMLPDFAMYVPPVVIADAKNLFIDQTVQDRLNEIDPNILVEDPCYDFQVMSALQFPDKSLLLYDSGKLQKLAKLLYELKSGGHRVLIFTQMTKVLDILEIFLNGLGYLYSRLDGATKIEERQLLTEKFNRDPRITCFILSTRSGGLGINLTGADTVIFYDNDWNPAMDKQCQDRCHRIGQTRDVHIYRFVSEFTIEENIMKKSNYKRRLDNVVIQDGDFTTDYFGKLTLSDLLGLEASNGDSDKLLLKDSGDINGLSQVEDAEDAAAAKEALKESNLDTEDFNDTSSTNTPQENNTLAGQLDDNAEKSSNKDKIVRFTTRNNSNYEYFDDTDDDTAHIDEYMLNFIENGFYY